MARRENRSFATGLAGIRRVLNMSSLTQQVMPVKCALPANAIDKIGSSLELVRSMVARYMLTTCDYLTNVDHRFRVLAS